MDWLRKQTADFADAVAGLDPDEQVPTCPEWPVRVLVGHIGQAHRWAAGIVRTGTAAEIPDPAKAEPPPDWSDWLLAGAQELTDAVTKADDGDVWTFLGPRPVRFWYSHMLHDVAVHYVDASITAGVEYKIDPDIATDALADGFPLLADPATARFIPEIAQLRGHGQTLLFRSTDGGSWLFTRTPDGLRVGPADTADVTVTGTAQDLVLLIYRRITPDDVLVDGDNGLLAHFLDRMRF